MKKYKLIKEYPGSPELDTIVSKVGNYYLDTKKESPTVWLFPVSVEKYPKFWSEIKEPNYLITAFKMRGTGAHRPIGKDGLYGYTEPFTSLQDMLRGGHEVYSVKNSKGIEWTFGDRYTFEAGDLVHKITSFDILGDELVINHERGRCSIEHIVKAKEPIFTSADGIEYTEENLDYKLFSVLPKATWEEKRSPVSYALQSKSWLHFHTKEARQEYIDNNKPKYSLVDIEKAYNDSKTKSGLLIELKKLGK